jgi:hypothetical protein
MINEDKLLEDIGKYLETKGWKAMVISFKGIAKGNLKNNYSLIVDFTGKKIKASSLGEKKK